MSHNVRVHAYRLVFPDGDHGPELRWEWEWPYIAGLLWNAKTFGRAVVQRYFTDWDALAAANQRLWETYYVPRPAYQCWESWQRWLSEYQTLVAMAQEVYEAQYGAHATTPTWSHNPQGSSTS
jgi:hypothetical protein